MRVSKIAHIITALLIILVVCSRRASGQEIILPGQAPIQQTEGCTDPEALNFNPDAGINDGSCQYAPLSLPPRNVIRKLPEAVNETSGLIWWMESYWTHNDSDGRSELYRLDPSNGKIIQTIGISNAPNFDWEDLAHDSLYIYIGDFGNNFGNRLKLTVYRARKSDIPFDGDTAIQADSITFNYGEQLDYSIRNLANNYDCEAMISYGDSLYLFSKNWVSLTSRLYALPKVPGHYTIYAIDEFDADGLITGAAIDSQKRVVLTGYKNYSPFIWVLSDYWRNDFFGGNKRRIDLKNSFGTQLEAVTDTSHSGFIFSCEKTAISRARLFRLPF